MPGTGALRVAGVIAAAWPNGTYEAVLANGHRLRAFVPSRARATAPRFSPGEQVQLELSPGDLSKGRIVLETQAAREPAGSE